MTKVFLLTILFFSNSLLLAAPAPLKLGLNWKPEPQFGGFYEADFKKQNLNVEILEGGSGTPTVQMLAHDQLDYGIISAEELIISNEKNPGTPLVALFAVYKTNPQMIMTHAERGFKGLQDVFQNPGHLAVQQGLSYVQYLKKKYAPLKVELVPYLGGIGNFQSDKSFSQQGFVNSEDLLAEKAGLKIKTFLIAESGFNPYTTVLATQQSRVQKQPDQVKKLVEAVRAGWKNYLASPEKTNKQLASLNKAMNSEILSQSAERQKKLIDVPQESLGQMKLERWKTLQDQLFELGLIKTKTPAEKYFFKQ